MKVRWREHEMIFVTMLVVAEIIILLLKMYNASYEQVPVEFAATFSKNGLSFIYWKNVLIPQASSILLFYVIYLTINLVILPSIKRISFNDFEKLATINIIKPIFGILIISYVLSIGINLITYYARPHLFNYGEYGALSLLGYNDRPLENLFFGFDRSVMLVVLITALTGLRELSIWLISKPDQKREFRILVTNNITSLVSVYLLLLFLLNPDHEDFLVYFSCVTPVLLLYIYLTFWLFPYKGDRSFIQRPVYVRLLLATVAGTLLFVLVFWNRSNSLQFLLYWAFLLLIVTPLSWLLFQQRRDKIMQLKGMETALARSNADLQFLRSQINPHFLFNSLNTLYGTALTKDAELTAQGIQQLGDMMRFMLHDNTSDIIPISKEIEYLRNFLALQKLRIQASPDISIEDNIDDAICDCNIAPMLLIPFVENAFKHGISLEEPSWIKIILQCTGNRIHFEVHNSMHQASTIHCGREESGVGLRNVLKRLTLLYPRRHEIAIVKEHGEYRVNLTIIISDNKSI